ncbi:MAG: hypothetical protein L6V85_05130 [Clostridiales bacterium]|nr:MAG: hypothetical protein L6V85_05130 [Clostridiales bacterium]
MKDSVRDVYAATVCYLKEEGKLDGTPYAALSIEQLINTVDNTLLKMCETVLLEQRKHIKGYEVDFGKDDMINKIAYVDLAWSGDAMYAIEESYNPDKTFKNLATGEETNYLLDYFVPTIEIDGEEKKSSATYGSTAGQSRRPRKTSLRQRNLSTLCAVPTSRCVI